MTRALSTLAVLLGLVCGIALGGSQTVGGIEFPGSGLVFPEQASAPPTPASGFGIAWIGSDGRQRYTDDAGTNGKVYAMMRSRYDDVGTAITQNTPAKSTTVKRSQSRGRVCCIASLRAGK